MLTRQPVCFARVAGAECAPGELPALSPELIRLRVVNAILQQQLPRCRFVVLAAVPAHLVIDQSRIALQLGWNSGDHVGSVAVELTERHPSLPQRPISGIHAWKNALRRGGAPGPQQPVDPLGLVFAGQNVAEGDVEIVLVLDRLRVGVPPCDTRSLLCTGILPPRSAHSRIAWRLAGSTVRCAQTMQVHIIGCAGIEHLLGLLPKQLLLRPVGIVDDEPGDLREACVRERTCGVDPENELADDWVLGERGKLLRLRPIAAGASQQRFEGSRRDVGGDSIRDRQRQPRQRPPCQQGDSQDARTPAFASEE